MEKIATTGALTRQLYMASTTPWRHCANHIVNFNQNSMELWNTTLEANSKPIAQVNIQCSTYQGDALYPLLFYIGLNLLRERGRLGTGECQSNNPGWNNKYPEIHLEDGPQWWIARRVSQAVEIQEAEAVEQPSWKDKPIDWRSGWYQEVLLVARKGGTKAPIMAAQEQAQSRLEQAPHQTRLTDIYIFKIKVMERNMSCKDISVHGEVGVYMCAP